jgi:hypothetical protein
MNTNLLHPTDRHESDKHIRMLTRYVDENESPAKPEERGERRHHDGNKNEKVLKDKDRRGQHVKYKHRESRHEHGHRKHRSGDVSRKSRHEDKQQRDRPPSLPRGTALYRATKGNIPIQSTCEGLKQLVTDPTEFLDAALYAWAEHKGMNNDAGAKHTRHKRRHRHRDDSRKQYDVEEPIATFHQLPAANLFEDNRDLYEDDRVRIAGPRVVRGREARSVSQREHVELPASAPQHRPHPMGPPAPVDQHCSIEVAPLAAQPMSAEQRPSNPVVVSSHPAVRRRPLTSTVESRHPEVRRRPVNSAIEPNRSTFRQPYCPESTASSVPPNPEHQTINQLCSAELHAWYVKLFLGHVYPFH